MIGAAMPITKAAASEATKTRERRLVGLAGAGWFVNSTMSASWNGGASGAISMSR
jgi:hypothetical protein